MLCRLVGFINDGARYITFVALLFCCDLAINVWFRSLAYIAPNAETAQIISGPSTSMVS